MVLGSTPSLRMTTLMVLFSAVMSAIVMCSGATKLWPSSLDLSRARSKISLAVTLKGMSGWPLPRLPLPRSDLTSSRTLWMVMPVFMNPPARLLAVLLAPSSTIRPRRSSSVVTSDRPMALASFCAAMTALMARSVKRSKTIAVTCLLAPLPRAPAALATAWTRAPRKLEACTLATQAEVLVAGPRRRLTPALPDLAALGAKPEAAWLLTLATDNLMVVFC
mmetsp:Transcript_9626/g.24644  ORF Transcript_9626/g.24644 Transcript_9626/m.24644 type:complete len:221 (+) Transcript_9626:2055-2717(+)